MSTITFVPTQRGGTALLFDGYRYNKVRCNNDKNVTYWRCSKNRNCPGRAVTVDNRVKKTNNKHNHPPETPLPHHHHALLGHHHHSLHHSLQQQHQQQQLLQHHGLHSTPPNPFLSARHAATAAAAAALAAATSHHHHHHNHHHQQQQQHHQFSGTNNHHQHHHNSQNYHNSSAPPDHLQSHSPSSNVSGSSSSHHHHHNLLQQFANAATNSAANHQQHQAHLGSSPSQAAVAAAAIVAANSGYHSRQQQQQQQHSSLISSPPMRQTPQSLLDSVNSASLSSPSANAFLNQLSDTLKYQQSCLINTAAATNTSSANSNQNISDSLQAQLAILSRLGNINGPFKGNPFNLTMPQTNKDPPHIPGNLIKNSNSSSGNHPQQQYQPTNLNSSQNANENATATLAAAIRSLQSTIGNQQQPINNQHNITSRSSPILSASSSSSSLNQQNQQNYHHLNIQQQHVPRTTRSPKLINKQTSGGANQMVSSHPNYTTITHENDECDTRSLSFSSSSLSSPSAAVNNSIRPMNSNVMINQLDQLKLLANNHNSPTNITTTTTNTNNEDNTKQDNNNANNLRQMIKRETRSNIEHRQGSPPDNHPTTRFTSSCYSQQQLTTQVNNTNDDVDIVNNALTSSASPTNFLADYLAGTLKCLIAATGGLSQQQLAALGSSIQAALSGTTPSSSLNSGSTTTNAITTTTTTTTATTTTTTMTNEATSIMKMSDKTTINLPNSNQNQANMLIGSSSNNSLSLNDDLGRKLEQQKSLEEEEEDNDSISKNNFSHIDDDTDECSDDNQIRTKDIKNNKMDIVDNDGDRRRADHFNRLSSFSSSSSSHSSIVEEINGTQDDYSNDARDYTKKNSPNSRYHHHNRCSPNSVRSSSPPQMNNKIGHTNEKHRTSLDDDLTTSERINNMEIDVLQQQQFRSKRLLPNSLNYKSHGLDLRGPFSRHQRQQHHLHHHHHHQQQQQQQQQQQHNDHIQAYEQTNFLDNNVAHKFRCQLTNGQHDIIGDSSCSRQSKDGSIVEQKTKVSVDSKYRIQHSIYGNSVGNEDNDNGGEDEEEEEEEEEDDDDDDDDDDEDDEDNNNKNEGEHDKNYDSDINDATGSNKVADCIKESIIWKRKYATDKTNITPPPPPTTTTTTTTTATSMELRASGTDKIRAPRDGGPSGLEKDDTSPSRPPSRPTVAQSLDNENNDDDQQQKKIKLFEGDAGADSNLHMCRNSTQAGGVGQVVDVYLSSSNKSPLIVGESEMGDSI